MSNKGLPDVTDYIQHDPQAKLEHYIRTLNFWTATGKFLIGQRIDLESQLHEIDRLLVIADARRKMTEDTIKKINSED